MRAVISPSCCRSITSVSSSPLAANYTWMGGNQRLVFSIEGVWPDFNPRLSFSPESLADWKVAVRQCPISLLVYPLNCEDGWKSSLTSYQELRGRVALELDDPKRLLISLHACLRLSFVVWSHLCCLLSEKYNQ